MSPATKRAIEQECEKHTASFGLALVLIFVGLLIVVIALAGWIGVGLYLALCGILLFRSMLNRVTRQVTSAPPIIVRSVPDPMGNYTEKPKTTAPEGHGGVQ